MWEILAIKSNYEQQVQQLKKWNFLFSSSPLLPPAPLLKAKATDSKFEGLARIAAMLSEKSSSNDVNHMKVRSLNRNKVTLLSAEEEQERCRRHVGQNHRECLNGCSGGGPEPDCKVSFRNFWVLHEKIKTRCEQKHHEDMRKCNTLEDDAERERCAHQAQMNFQNCMEENCQRPE